MVGDDCRLVASDGSTFDWDELARSQGTVTVDRLSQRHAKPVLVALEDRESFAHENWRNVLVVVHSAEGYVQLFDRLGAIIEEADENGVKRDKQPLENFLAEFDGVNGQYYRTPSLRPAPRQRNRSRTPPETPAKSTDDPETEAAPASDTSWEPGVPCPLLAMIQARAC